MPSDEVDATRTLPPCRVAMSRTSASPMPKPGRADGAARNDPFEATGLDACGEGGVTAVEAVAGVTRGKGIDAVGVADSV